MSKIDFNINIMVRIPSLTDALITAINVSKHTTCKHYSRITVDVKEWIHTFVSNNLFTCLCKLPSLLTKLNAEVQRRKNSQLRCWLSRGANR